MKKELPQLIILNNHFHQDNLIKMEVIVEDSVAPHLAVMLENPNQRPASPRTRYDTRVIESITDNKVTFTSKCWEDCGIGVEPHVED